MLRCFSRVQLFATLWTAACQAPLSMGLYRQEYWREDCHVLLQGILTDFDKLRIFFLNQVAWLVVSWFSDQGLNLSPTSGIRVLATEPPGESQGCTTNFSSRAITKTVFIIKKKVLKTNRINNLEMFKKCSIKSKRRQETNCREQQQKNHTRQMWIRQQNYWLKTNHINDYIKCKCKALSSQ